MQYSVRIVLGALALAIVLLAAAIYQAEAAEPPVMPAPASPVASA